LSNPASLAGQKSLQAFSNHATFAVKNKTTLFTFKLVAL
jgi:hypothetical protein